MQENNNTTTQLVHQLSNDAITLNFEFGELCRLANEINEPAVKKRTLDRLTYLESILPTSLAKENSLVYLGKRVEIFFHELSRHAIEQNTRIIISVINQKLMEQIDSAFKRNKVEYPLMANSIDVLLKYAEAANEQSPHTQEAAGLLANALRLLKSNSHHDNLNIIPAFCLAAKGCMKNGMFETGKHLFWQASVLSQRMNHAKTRDYVHAHASLYGIPISTSTKGLRQSIDLEEERAAEESLLLSLQNNEIANFHRISNELISKNLSNGKVRDAIARMDNLLMALDKYVQTSVHWLVISLQTTYLKAFVSLQNKIDVINSIENIKQAWLTFLIFMPFENNTYLRTVTEQVKEMIVNPGLSKFKESFQRDGLDFYWIYVNAEKLTTPNMRKELEQQELSFDEACHLFKQELIQKLTPKSSPENNVNIEAEQSPSEEGYDSDISSSPPSSQV